jgi:hypothetical protein
MSRSTWPSGVEVRADVAFVVLLRFITRQPVEERGDVVDGQAGLFGDRLQRPLVGPDGCEVPAATLRPVYGQDDSRVWVRSWNLERRH